MVQNRWTVGHGWSHPRLFLPLVPARTEPFPATTAPRLRTAAYSSQPLEPGPSKRRLCLYRTTLAGSRPGVYSLAFGIAMWPTSVIGSMLNSVVLPAASGVLRDGGDVAVAVVQGARTISLVVFPLGAFLFADQLILTIYGQAWASAGPVLSILAAYGVLFVFGLFMANIMIAMGKTVILFGVQVAALAALIPALWAGITLWGLEGAAIAHIVVVGAVTSPVYLLGLRRSTSLRLTDLFGHSGSGTVSGNHGRHRVDCYPPLPRHRAIHSLWGIRGIGCLHLAQPPGPGRPATPSGRRPSSR